MYKVATENGCSPGYSLTNLQIPVDNPINMAVMDTLEDLLYAVAGDRRVTSTCRIAMEQMEGKTERQETKRKEERQRREYEDN